MVASWQKVSTMSLIEADKLTSRVIIGWESSRGIDVTFATNYANRHLGNNTTTLFLLLRFIRRVLVLLGLFVFTGDVLLCHGSSEVDRSDKASVCPVPDLDEAVFRGREDLKGVCRVQSVGDDLRGVAV